MDRCGFIVGLSFIHSDSKWNVNRTLLEARHHSPCRWPSSGNTPFEIICGRAVAHISNLLHGTHARYVMVAFLRFVWVLWRVNQPANHRSSWWLTASFVPSQRIHFYQAIALLPWTWPSPIFPTVWRVPQQCHWQEIRGGVKVCHLLELADFYR